VVSECLSEESAKKVKLVFRVAEAPEQACGKPEHSQSVVSECVSEESAQDSHACL